MAGDVRSLEHPLEPGSSVVVLGLGLTGRAVCRALRSRGYAVTAIEDRPTAATAVFAEQEDIVLLAEPTDLDRVEAITAAAAFLPSPGVPESHPAFAEAAAAEVPVLSEFDLARWWDHRPIAAITGTDGKTSVTLLTVAMLEASGIHAVAVGNTETPLVEVIDDPMIDVFVVEASSFRLGHSQRFSPTAAAWLNFSPDHLDVHASLERYEWAKAKIWEALPEGGLAVAPVGDEIVVKHLPTDRDIVLVSAAPIDQGAGASARLGHVVDGTLTLDDTGLLPVSDLPRTFDHDITNALVAAALARHLGASDDGIRRALTSFELPPHRIQYVATIDGVDYYNDSKATVPHAVNTAVSAFDSVVLIAGGKNKGLDLGEMAESASRIRSVVAIGDAAGEVAAAFDGVVDVSVAIDMEDAVQKATDVAAIGDAVLLSPGCASFDAYANYGARGEHFMSVVRSLEGDA